MKVSYLNRLLTATSLTATNASLNRPVSNLLMNFLQLPFQSTTTTSVITGVLDAEYSIDHVAYGYHNLSGMVIRFYNIVGALITTITPTLAAGENIFYFTSAVAGVKTITFTITSAADAYIGKLFVGEYLELANFQQSPEHPLYIRGEVTKSAGGQVSGNRFFNPRGFKMVLPVNSFTDWEALLDYVDYCGNSYGHFIDQYPDRLDRMSVKFVHLVLDELGGNKRRISDWLYQSGLEYEEAK